MQKRQRVGLIGAGFIGRTHARLAKEVPDIEMVGYVDPAPRSDHADLKDLRHFTNIESMLKEGLDGTIIAVPDDLHVSTAKQCLSSGVAVFLEKPAARNLPEGLDLASAPHAKTRLLVGHQRRHHVASKAVKDIIAQGRLGKLIGVNGIFALRKDDKYFIERPRGVGLVNLIHDLDLLQYFCGRITAVSAAVSHAGRGAKEEDTIALTMEFDTGIIGSMIATDSSPSPWGWDQATIELPSIPFIEQGTTYALLGTKGSLSIPDLNIYSHGSGEAWHHPLQHAKLSANGSNAYVTQLTHFADIMAGKARPIVGIDEALATQAALEAVFHSARSGRRVATQDLINEAQGTKRPN